MKKIRCLILTLIVCLLITAPAFGAWWGTGGSTTVAKTTTTALTAAECGSKNTFYTITNTGASGAIVLTLEDAIVGRKIRFKVAVTYNMDVNPQDTDQIDYLTDAAGNAIRGTTAGEFITLECNETGHWTPYGRLGSWADVD